MRIEKKEKFNILYADEKKHIRAVNDVYKEAYVDDEGYEIEEYKPNYFKMAYVPKNVNENNVYDMYVEEDENE